MDQIRLTGVRAVGKHGVLDFEHERAQTFVVDTPLYLDLAPLSKAIMSISSKYWPSALPA